MSLQTAAWNYRDSKDATIDSDIFWGVKEILMARRRLGWLEMLNKWSRKPARLGWRREGRETGETVTT